jgi:hypothetical protein
MISINFLNEAH